MLIKAFVVLIIFQATLFSCNLCKFDVPNVHIATIVTPQKKSTKFEVTWEFDGKFIASLTAYDTNQNQIFESTEKEEIKKSLLEYLAKTNYLTQIAFVKKDEKITEKLLQKIESATYSFSFVNNTMSFTYQFFLPIVPLENHKIVLYFFDTGKNFNFIIKDIVVKDYEGTKNLKIGQNKAEILFYDLASQSQKNTQSPIVNETKSPTLLENFSFLLQTYKIKLEELIKEIQATNSFFSYFWLLFFSFLYGILHAIGPGHGKSLVGAYFLSENRSMKKAFSIALLIGIVHTFSAFIFTITIYFVVGLLFSNIFSDIEAIATKISGVMIVVVALYLLYKKYTHKNKMNFSINKPTSWLNNNSNNHHSCECGACATNSTDLGVILSAGIVPCAGTVSVFLFTIGLGVYFVGFLSAIFMSLGMSLVIFTTAYFSQNVRKRTAKQYKYLKYFEYASLMFILFLGISLLA